MKSDKTQLLLENKALFEAVITEFYEKPYQMVSLNEIIRNCGYNKGSFYYRFANKQELFVALMDYLLVVQIDLFGQKKIDFMNLNSLEDLLRELYCNLIELFQYNEMYYYIVKKSFSDHDTSSLIEQECIEPLYKRFFQKLDSYEDTNNFLNLKLIIKNLYFNFPEDVIRSSNHEDSIKSLIGVLISQKEVLKRKLDLKNISLGDFEQESNLCYILSAKQNYDLGSSKISAFSDFHNFKSKKHHLKKKLGIALFNYDVIISKAIKHSFRNIYDFNAFLTINIRSLVNNNYRFKQLVLLSLYYLLSQPEYIVYDFVLDEFTIQEKREFFAHILPLLSKTSKILVLGDSYESSYAFNEVYYLNALEKLALLTNDMLERGVETLQIQKEINGIKTYNNASLSDLQNINLTTLYNSTDSFMIQKNRFISSNTIRNEDNHEANFRYIKK